MSNSKLAIPLCLPDNCQWDPQMGKYSNTENAERQTLKSVSTALQKLRAIEGPVCVVTIVGPCRKGKSYILSKAFDQGEVFPLGHLLDPETMGIWMWVVPEKYTDRNGQEFTVVLLDSEGIDAMLAKKPDDHRVFTLTVLLASVMIYNSAGVPTRTDLDSLEYPYVNFILKLSQRIQFQAGKTKMVRDEENFYKTFPFFIWLLRDVVLQLPPDCPTIKDYFLKKIMNSPSNTQSDKKQEVAESILKYFPGFEAFKLPPPSLDPNVIQNLNDECNLSEINKYFIEEVQTFKQMLLSTLNPKKSFIEGEYVTGEALATLVEVYVDALNTPGAVPNVESAWDVFIQSKCSQATKMALETYEEQIKAQLKSMLPCPSDQIREAHRRVFRACLETFKRETNSISVKNMEKYLKKLTVQTESILSSRMKENDRLTEELCVDLIHKLKKSKLDPVLAELISPGGSKISFQDILAAYAAVEQCYKAQAKGANDVIAKVFYNIHPELQSEMKKHVGFLQKLKDYDENLAKEQAARAEEEKEKQRIQEEIARLEEERLRKEKEMELLMTKHKVDQQRMRQQFKCDLELQKRQMDNMMEANMNELRREREDLLEHNRSLEEAVKGMQSTMQKKSAQFEEERLRKEQEMKQLMLQQQVDELRRRKQFERDLKLQKQQTDNMQEANMNELRRQREEFPKQTRSLEERPIAMQRSMQKKSAQFEERLRKEPEMQLFRIKQEEDQQRMREQLTDYLERDANELRRARVELQRYLSSDELKAAVKPKGVKSKVKAVTQAVVKVVTESLQPLMYFTKKQDARAEEEKEKHKIQDPCKKILGDVAIFEARNRCDNIRCLPYKLDKTNFSVTIYLHNGDGKVVQRLEEDALHHFSNANLVEVIDLAVNPPNSKAIRYPVGFHVLQKETAEQISKEIKQNLDSFRRHRNVTAVYASYKVRNLCQTTIPCVKVCVLGKGRIPLGDHEFPTRLGAFEVDVEEGYFAECVEINKCWRSSSPLKLGVSIGVQGIDGSGTLGAFLINDDNNLFVLSCEHVMNPNNDSKPYRGSVEQPSSLDHANYIAHYENQLEKQRVLVSKLEEVEEEQRPSRARALSEAKNRQDIYGMETRSAPPRKIAEYKSGIKDNVVHGGYEYYVDAAIAELSRPEAQLLQTVGITLADENAKEPSGKYKSVKTFSDHENMKLQKVGRTTAWTKNGILDPSNVNILCNQADIKGTDAKMHSGLAHAFYFHCSKCGAETEMNGNGECSSCCCSVNFQQWRHNCLLIRGERGGFFAKLGDSGAMVIDQNGDACGIIFGFLDIPSCDQYFALACPMEVVLAHFREKFDPTLRIVGV